jgi:hypothetical protein
MTHEEAIGGLLAESYLLGELTGDTRDEFETHLFNCAECAMDLKAGAAMLAAVRLDLAAPTAKEVSGPTQSRPLSWRSLLNPVWLAPAFAACLALLAYQNAIQVPGLKNQLAQANAPEVLNSVILSGGEARGGDEPRVIAKIEASFLLSVDIPPVGGYQEYRCTLISPSGKEVWHTVVTPEQAKDAVQIRVPTAITQAGRNSLAIEGIRNENGLPTKSDKIVTRTFDLKIRR